MKREDGSIDHRNIGISRASAGRRTLVVNFSEGVDHGYDVTRSGGGSMWQTSKHKNLCKGTSRVLVAVVYDTI